MDKIKKLLSTHEQRQTFLEDIRTGIYLWDCQTGEFYPSKHLLNILGYDVNDKQLYHYHAWRDIWHPDDQANIDITRENAIKQHEKEYHLFHRLRHKDGFYAWFKTNALIIYEDDKPKTIIGSTNNFEKVSHKLEELEVEQAIYKNYLKATNAGTWIWDITSSRIIIDEQWASLLGYTLDELQPISYDTWVKLVYKEDIVQVEAELNQAIKDNAHYNATYRMLHKNGSIVYIEDSGIVITHDKHGSPQIMIGTHLDVTKTKLLEIELRENEIKYRQLVESSYDVIYQVDLEGKVVFLSDAIYTILGYEPVELLNQKLTKIIHPDDLQALGQFFISVRYAHKKFQLLSFRAIHKNGQIKHFQTNAKALITDQGIIGVSGTAMDMTEQKNLEDKLAYEKDLFKKTLLSVSDGVISVNQEGIIIIMNDSAEKLTGYKIKDALNKPLDAIFKVEKSNHQTFDKRIKRMYNDEVLLRRKSGKLISIERNMTPIKNASGQKDGYVIVFRDITDRIKKAKDIEYLSYHDYLTGMYNRRYMENALRGYDQKINLPLGLFMIDVNDLKEMNDQYGHQAGDMLLQKVSETITSLAPNDAVLGRIGGDEFMIIMPNTNNNEMRMLKDKLLAAFYETKLHDKKVKVAIGMALKTKQTEPLSDIMKKADDLMYQHKRTLRY